MKCKTFCVAYDKSDPFYITLAGITKCTEPNHIKRSDSPFYTLEYMLKGKERITQDKETLDVEEGDVFLLHQGCDHEYQSDGEEWIKVWINFSGNLAESLIRNYGLSGNILFKNADVYSFFKRFIALCRSDLPADKINSKAALLYHELLQELTLNLQKGEKKVPEAIKLRTYIDANITRDITLDELAKVIYKSRSQVIRIFKNEYGTTPYEYLLAQRFRQAKALLLGSNLLIKEIASQTGFPNEHYFSILFRKKCGETPMEYRKRNKWF